ncbi:hypothetical protein B2K_23375 [Paenibacillus mucilaginosus K02]|uniref:Multidrug transporter MatE n=1 Tax=Paenibacillus mucilaginosus K02 TaxID=997761 RepID=I0BMK1_9BACL|nr:hypothetical protein B2K_23375 [Paenibacillus mucilaginosus K02]
MTEESINQKLNQTTSTGTPELSLARITWPILVEMLLHLLMGNLDILMLSHYSERAVASVGIANQLLQFFIMLFGFVAAGTTIVVSQDLGGGQRQKAVQAACTAAAMNSVLGLGISLALSGGAAFFLTLLGTPDEMMGEAGTYLRIVGSFLFLEAVMLTGSAVLRSYGLTREVMWISIGMNAVHVLGNALVLYGPFGLPQLGLEGVAWSTVVSRLLAMTAILYVAKRTLRPRLKPASFLREAGAYARRLLRIGIPSTIEYMAYYVSQLIITSFIVSIGIAALTTRVYADSVLGIVSLLATSIAVGTQIIVSRLVGGRRMAEAEDECRRSIRWSMGLCAAAAAGAAFAAEPLLGLFTEDPAVIREGTRVLWLMLLFQPAHSLCMIYQHVLKAAGDPAYPAKLGVLFMIGIRVPVSWLCITVFDLGIIGVYAAFILDEWTRALLMRRRWAAGRWRTGSGEREAVTTAAVS